MMDVNNALKRIKDNGASLEELQNVDLVICQLMAKSAQRIDALEQDYAAAFLEALELGYKMTNKKARWKATRRTGGEYQSEKRKFGILEKIHEHISFRIKSLQAKIISDKAQA